MLFTISLLALPSTSQAQEAASSPSIQNALQPFVEKHELAGAVTLVADKDKILSINTVGFADIAAKKPMKADCLFWIASQSKPITAVGLMMLIESGKVKLDDPVSRYLPEFNNQWVIAEKKNDQLVLKKPKTPVTVRHVLSHTSGMPFASSLETPTLDMLVLKDAVRSYALTPLNTEPGTKYNYSNAGINTAARIIEVVTGKKYEDYMDEMLFKPLGMKDTTFWPNEEQLTRLAKTFRPNAAKNDLEETTISQLTYPLNDHKRQPMPAGGLFSTAVDVSKFCRMLLNGGKLDGKQYLTEASIKEMTKKQTAEGIKDNYGLGFSAGESFGHGGALSTNMSVETKPGLVLVWLVQHAGYPGKGGESQGAFRQAAYKEFAKPK
ncbi:beta-lactamase family protein [Telmatocola sphagniphila]|uniref:Beta-lactamase family protein n=2 Tax=Telmatocola sphagniphila TaxID=1123043 RepID=A0A8E6EVE0_9BACT|nr:beta-lactamase family protein [Telmatocola sphagniphila]